MQMGDYYKKYPEKVKALNAAYRKANKEKCREWGKASYHRCKQDPKNIKAYLLKYAKARASRKGLEFELTPEDLVLPEVCPIMQIPFDRNTRKYGYSIDRIDPTRGYTKDNVWVISQIANAMKWDSSHKERVAFAKWVLSLEGGNQT